MTNAEAWFNIALRPRKPEGSLGRIAQDGHLDSHTAPELAVEKGNGDLAIYTTNLVCGIPGAKEEGEKKPVEGVETWMWSTKMCSVPTSFLLEFRKMRLVSGTPSRVMVRIGTPSREVVWIGTPSWVVVRIVDSDVQR